MHIKDVYPVNTVVRLKKTGQVVLITDVCLLNNSEHGFLNYLGKIEGRGEGKYAIYHQDVELASLPNQTINEKRTDPPMAFG